MSFVDKVYSLFDRKWLIAFLSLCFLTPLIFSSDTNELYEFPKMFFVYKYGTWIIAFFVISLVSSGKLTSVKIPPLPVLVYLSSFVISTIFSTHLYTSVWGYYSRFNDGLISVLIFLGLYIVAINKLNKKGFSQVNLVFILTLIPIGLLSIGQHFGSNFIWSASLLDRAYSTFGQPNWLAQYVSILIPFLMFAIFRFGNFTVFLPLYLIGFTSLWFSYSLSGVLALIISHAYLFSTNIKAIVSSRKVLFRLGITLLLVTLICIFNLGIFKGRIQDALTDVKKLISQEFIAFAQVLDSQPSAPSGQISDPGFIRTGLWKSTLKLITKDTKTLLIGTGPETYPYAFQPFRQNDLNYSSEWNFVFNKPHNYYLELWSEQGIFGLLSYLWLCIYLFTKSGVAKRAGLIAFLTTNLFGWPVVATSLIFWMWLAECEVTNA